MELRYLLILLFLCVFVLIDSCIYIPLHIDVKKDLKSITLKATFFIPIAKLKVQYTVLDQNHCFVVRHGRDSQTG